MGTSASSRQAAGQAQLDPRAYFQYDLPKFILNSRIGNGKFLKSYHVKVAGISLVVKVYVKLPEEDLTPVAARLSKMWRVLSPARYPNILPYQMWIKSSQSFKSNATPVYMIRQYLYSNLHNRLSTRPFLCDIEKMWFLYQLFKCVEVIHSHAFIHGDLKLENILCTTWHWLILTDFAPFKPVMLPDDDPTDFQFFFDAVGRSTCYIAPERFYHRDVEATMGDGVLSDMKALEGSTVNANAALTPAMDVFSLGCAVAEIFLGEAFLDLPGMLVYLQAHQKTPLQSTLNRLDEEDSPVRHLINRIENPIIRQLVIDMTQKNPDDRRSVSEYRHVLEGKQRPEAVLTSWASASPETQVAAESLSPCFPKYFSECLHPLFHSLHIRGSDPDVQIAIICKKYSFIMNCIAGEGDEVAAAVFEKLTQGLLPEDFDEQPAPVAPSQADVKQTAAARAASPSLYSSRPVPSAASTTVSSRGVGVVSMSSAQALRVMPTARVRKDGPWPLASANAVSGEDFVPESSPTEGSLLRYRPIQSQSILLTGLREDPLALKSMEASTPRVSNTAQTQDLKKLSIDELMRQCQSMIENAERGQFSFVSPLGDKISETRESTATQQTPVIAMQVAASLGNSERGSGFESLLSLESSNLRRTTYEGVVIPIHLVCCNFRHLRSPSFKFISLALLTRLAYKALDSVILQRVLPVFVHAMDDPIASVRAIALRSLCVVVGLVRQVDAIEANTFPNYIFPSLSVLSRDTDSLVRSAFAECIGSFAETAKRFLDIGHTYALTLQQLQQLQQQSRLAHSSGDVGAISAEIAVISSKTEDSPTLTSSPSAADVAYRKRLDDLRLQIFQWIREILVLSDRDFREKKLKGVGHVSIQFKKALLRDMVRLCVFLGHEQTLDTMLRILMTFATEEDWELRFAFYERLPSVCAYLGKTVCSEQVLPQLQMAIYDPEDKVAGCALVCMKSLAQLHLVTRLQIIHLATEAALICLHPCASLRQEAVALVCAAWLALGKDDFTACVSPQLRHVMRVDLTGCELTPATLSQGLLQPISRDVLADSIDRRMHLINAPNERESSKSPVSSFEGNAAIWRRDEILYGDIEDADVQAKLKVVSSYLDRAATEVLAVYGQKASRHLPPLTQRENPSQISAFRKVILSLDSILDPLSHSVAANTAHSFLVPLQKIGVQFFPTTASDKMRALAMADPLSLRTVSKIHSVFGMVLSHTDAARIIAGGTWDMWESAGMRSSEAAKQSVITAESTTSGMSVASSLPALTAGSAEQSEMTQNKTVSESNEFVALVRRIKALNVPALPPYFGSLMQPTNDRRYNGYLEALEKPAGEVTRQSNGTWRPRENVLVTTLSEHNKAVNNLCISPDHAFILSASDDKTVKVWRSKGIDRNPVVSSALTYGGHSAPVVSVTMLENSHTVASCSLDNDIHIWRLDTYFGGVRLPVESESMFDYSEKTVEAPRSSAITSSSEIRRISPTDGAVVAMAHFNGDLASVLTYVTQRGSIRGVDLRSSRDTFAYVVRPELGRPTCMALSPTRNWLCVGTSKGYVGLWDIRYGLMNKLWRHSSHEVVHRLAVSKPSSAQYSQAFASQHGFSANSEGGYLFVAAGDNEASLFGLPDGGECLKCFRSLPMSEYRHPLNPLPRLEEIDIPIHPRAPIMSALAYSSYTAASHGRPSVRAMLGRISSSGGESYIITAGTDSVMRYWDFSNAAKSFVVCGLSPGQPKALFQSGGTADDASSGGSLQSKLFLSYHVTAPSPKIAQVGQLPIREGRGLTTLPSSRFKDTITDLKILELPIRMVASSGRDGSVRLWR